MAATKEDIRGWLAAADRDRHGHMLVLYDEFDHTDFPLYVNKGVDVRALAAEYNKKRMLRVMEVYSLSLSVEEQLEEHRAFHYD